MITIKTDHPVALDSPDHIHPWGTINDNSKNLEFNKKLKFIMPELSVLDLGCSGGGFVKSILDQGDFAVGIEGSDISKNTQRAEWATIPDNLFTADITKPFELYSDNEPCLFSVVTMWEVIEHIKEQDLPHLFDNIISHLRVGGLLILSVSPSDDFIKGINLHQCVHDKPWWDEYFSNLGWQNQENILSLIGGDMVRCGNNAPGSFHYVLKHWTKL